MKHVLEKFKNPLLQWRILALLAVISWILVGILTYALAILSVTAYRVGGSDYSFQILSVAVLSALFITGMPGCVALVYPSLRKKLYTLPEAAALSSFILSFLLGMFLIIVFCFVLYHTDNFSFYTVRAGDSFQSAILSPLLELLLIGIAIFPLTIGLVFPFGIPFICAWSIRAMIIKDKVISQASWFRFVGISTLGWILVVFAGYILGNA